MNGAYLKCYWAVNNYVRTSIVDPYCPLGKKKKLLDSSANERKYTQIKTYVRLVGRALPAECNGYIAQNGGQCPPYQSDIKFIFVLYLRVFAFICGKNVFVCVSIHGRIFPFSLFQQEPVQSYE